MRASQIGSSRRFVESLVRKTSRVRSSKSRFENHQNKWLSRMVASSSLSGNEEEQDDRTTMRGVPRLTGRTHPLIRIVREDQERLHKLTRMPPTQPFYAQRSSIFPFDSALGVGSRPIVEFNNNNDNDDDDILEVTRNDGPVVDFLCDSVSLSTAPRMSNAVFREQWKDSPMGMRRLVHASRAYGGYQAAHPRIAFFSTSSSEDKKEFSTSATPSSSSSSEKKPMSTQIQEAIVSASKAIVDFLVKLPGWTWFYLTHPKDLQLRLQELWEATKKEAHHYWMGTKLLYADVQTASKLLNRLVHGSTLTRRERQQLLRTTSDLFRLVPFSMFILIPFMEFALPLALRLFPNMLPSTFQDSLKEEENMKRELKSRIAMAQFFQETLQGMAKEQEKLAAKRKAKLSDESSEGTKEIVKKQEQSASSMLTFLENARNGEMIPPEVIIQFATLFQDDLTLDHMARMQLINMCKYMNIPPYGSDAILRFQLRHRIRVLKEDDQRILWEGIDSLTKMELREACRERGMRSTGLSKDAYKRALQQWLDLSVNKNVPISLLIMSRTFFLRDEMTTTVPADHDETKSVASLADAISGLDKDVVNEVVLDVATPEEVQSDPSVRRIKLEVLEAQNERILEERMERDAASKKKEAKESSESSTDEMPDSILKTDVSTTSTEDDALKANKMEASTEADNQEEGKDAVDENELSHHEMDAITQLLHPDPVSSEREDLGRIKAALDEDAEDEEQPDVQEESQESIAAEQAAPTAEQEISDEAVAEAIVKMDAKVEKEADDSTTVEFEGSEDAAAEDLDSSGDGQLDSTIERLKSRVARMVDKIESQLEDVHGKIGDKLHFLDKDCDGIMTREEMAHALQTVLKRDLTFDEAMEIATVMDENQDGVLTVGEFTNWIETRKVVKLLEEGRDAELDHMIKKQTENQGQNDEKTEGKEA